MFKKLIFLSLFFILFFNFVCSDQGEENPSYESGTFTANIINFLPNDNFIMAVYPEGTTFDDILVDPSTFDGAGYFTVDGTGNGIFTANVSFENDTDAVIHGGIHSLLIFIDRNLDSKPDFLEPNYFTENIIINNDTELDISNNMITDFLNGTITVYVTGVTPFVSIRFGVYSQEFTSTQIIYATVPVEVVGDFYTDSSGNGSFIADWPDIDLFATADDNMALLKAGSHKLFVYIDSNLNQFYDSTESYVIKDIIISGNSIANVTGYEL